ncbi:LLM class F420-dependent oxidoreductase [Nonomuraea aridisoli]|uniref:LLM class F420-dependent oxidoreductase n=1 Tax=Nonomuraea aridisoli TaxID=2070368 RepID=A0A2W2E6U3_9ACTN|nr:LLM class F420-dependent oxidoreductase [Nonomuraea aridisoli]PZG12935.1 LLM class F420-dependent oxidoreductase [Nonomuraea aridisoli]
MDAVTRESFGRVGIWTWALRSTTAGEARRAEIAEAVAELEQLGYGTIWLGGSPSIADAEAVVRATERVTVATGILSIWDFTAQEVAEQVAALEEESPGRFVLGLGASHAVVTPKYAKPYSNMVRYLDELDAAPVPVGRERRLIAALGPKMLALAAERSLGAHPYLVSAEHTAYARSVMGPQALLAPEVKVVLDSDPERARARARAVIGPYLGLPNYTNNLLRHGFDESDLADGGSDRLVEALCSLGDAGRAAARVEEHLKAGADHVSVQIVVEGGPQDSALPRAEWRELAAALSLS